MSHPPPAFAARRGRPTSIPGYSQTVQKLRDRFGPLPLLHTHATQFAANPTPQIAQCTLGFRVAKVSHPANQERIELPHQLLEAHASITTCDLTNAVLRAFQTLGSYRLGAVFE